MPYDLTLGGIDLAVDDRIRRGCQEECILYYVNLLHFLPDLITS
jgi:hypothetical protein